jgi:hypothetical protein
MTDHAALTVRRAQVPARHRHPPPSSGILGGMPERRPTNSELHLQQLENEEREAYEEKEKGILEIFDEADEPLQRDQDRQPDS